MAGGPKFDEAGLAALGVTCTNPNVTAGNDYYYRICFLDNFQAAVLANFAMDEFDAKVAYCLGEAGNEYDQGLVAYFKQTFEAAGGTVITKSFPTNNSDFNSYLNEAKNEGADVIFTPVSIAYATQIITQANSLGITSPILGSDTLDDNMVLEAVKGTDIQLYVSTFYQEGGAPDFDEGIKNYINTNSDALSSNGGNDTIAAVTAMGYDAYFVALEAMKAANSASAADIKAALGSVTYSGVSGDIAFDEQGDAIRDTAYIKTADTAEGTWLLATVQKADSLS
jgi:branched-chain amino acid transport system substrate-binding protein